MVLFWRAQVFVLRGATASLTQPLEQPAREQAVQHCRLPLVQETPGAEFCQHFGCGEEVVLFWLAQVFALRGATVSLA